MQLLGVQLESCLSRLLFLGECRAGRTRVEGGVAFRLLGLSGKQLAPLFGQAGLALLQTRLRLFVNCLRSVELGGAGLELGLAFGLICCRRLGFAEPVLQRGSLLSKLRLRLGRGRDALGKGCFPAPQT